MTEQIKALDEIYKKNGISNAELSKILKKRWDTTWDLGTNLVRRGLVIKLKKNNRIFWRINDSPRQQERIIALLFKHKEEKFNAEN